MAVTGPSRAGIVKRCMVFVDGENLTIRAQNFAKEAGRTLGGKHLRDVYYWGDSVEGAIHALYPPSKYLVDIIRTYYYTCIVGDEDRRNSVRDALQDLGFSPVVFRKPKKQEKAKGVDIALAKDMVVHAALDNYDDAILVAGDGDYVPLLDEVKRLGKWAVVIFLDERHGLNPELRRAADVFRTITPTWKEEHD